MLKITQAVSSIHNVTLKLEGRVIGPWVEELSRVCEPFLKEERVLKLDLAKVSFADAEGVAALNNFKSRGAALENCSPFVAQQIKIAI